MKVSTLNADGSWTHEEFELPPEVMKELEEMQAEIARKTESGELAGWCACDDGKPAHDQSRYFDYREGSPDYTNGDEPDNLGYSHGWYHPSCGKLIQGG